MFRGIGVLNIRDSKVKMKFFKDFLNSMDGSGNLVRVLANVSIKCLNLIVRTNHVTIPIHFISTLGYMNDLNTQYRK